MATFDLAFASTASGAIFSPKRVVVGDGSISMLEVLLQDLVVNPGELLVVSDPALVQLGVTARALDPVQGAGYYVEVWDQVMGEPDLRVLEEIAAFVRKRRYVAVIGLGGGSAMDPAKMAAALATNPGPVDRYLDSAAITQESLPLILIPTTAGTGAEASKNSIVTTNGRKVIISNIHLTPSVAILDPTLTISSPPNITASSGMDALAHAIEAAISTLANPLTMMLSVTAIHGIASSLRRAFDDGTDLEARRGMLYSAYLAGLSINAGLVLGHSMAYTIATRTQLPHGVATAMSLPYCIAYSYSGAKKRLDTLRSEVAEGTRSLPMWVKGLCDDLQIPGSLREVGVQVQDLEGMVDECFEKYPRPNSPVPFNRDRLLDLYSLAYKGDVELTVEAFVH